VAAAGQGWVGRLGPWVGIGTSPAALMAGGGLAEGTQGVALVATLLAGVAALTALAVTQGALGVRLRLPLAAIVAGPLGTAGGRRVGSLVMLALMLGWYGVNVDVAGTATARLLGVPDRAGMVLFGLVTLAAAWRGVAALSWAALAAGLATVVLAGWGLRLAAQDHGLALASAHTATDPVGHVQGAALVVGFGAAFALRTPDFTRDLARPRQVLWCGLVGLALPLTAFCLAGAALQAATGTWNLADVLRGLGSPTAAYLFVAVGFLGSVMTNVWSGALALCGAAPVGHGRAMAAVAAAGLAIAATGFGDRMLEYLVAMAIVAPGLTVLCWLAWRRGAVPPVGWRTAGLLGWGLSVALGLTAAAFRLAPGPVVAAAVATFVGLRLRPPVGQTAASGHTTRRAHGDRGE
jgi:cytosine permease